MESTKADERRVVGSQHVAAHSAGWRVFKLGSVVADLQEAHGHPRHSLVAFEVRAMTADGQVLPLGLHHGARGSRQPLLVLFNKQASINDTRNAADFGKITNGLRSRSSVSRCRTYM